MTIPAVFEFAPHDYVTVTLFGIGYKGRVQRCILDDGVSKYDVQYADDRGELKRGEFYADELKGVK